MQQNTRLINLNLKQINMVYLNIAYIKIIASIFRRWSSSAVLIFFK